MAARLIFVPGMKPKPPPDSHRRELLRTLTAALARVRPGSERTLVERPECFSLVSWTYRFYRVHRDIALDVHGVDRLLENPAPSAEDIREIDALERRLSRRWRMLGDALPPLGWLTAKTALRLTMSEAQRYLDDVGGIATQIRGLLRDEIVRAWRAAEPVLLIGHSLGSVIAYDTLWDLCQDGGEPGRIDLFVTLGSPLATRFVRRSLRGATEKGPCRYPTNIRRWENFSAKGDETALHPRLVPFFGEMSGHGLLESLTDHADLYNPFRGDLGLNVHASYGYLMHHLVAGLIGDWLEARR